MYIDKRRQVGHWVGDTIIGAKHKQGIIILVDRKTSDLTCSTTIRRLAGVAALVKTITFDNGKEFAEHARVDRALRSKGYFVEPFSSWQRVINEKLNGLVRQYIPKKRPLLSVTDTELSIIEDLLNNRPRKRLGFKTPHEFFTQSINRVALRT